MNMSYGIVYELFCVTSGLRYVGQTVSSLRKRWNGHCNQALKTNSDLEISKAIRENGRNSFQTKILCECESKKELNVMERKFIADLSTVYPHGYNMTNGGEGPCELTRKKISERTKAAMANVDPACKERQCQAMQDPVLRQKISERTKAAMQRPEVKDKVAQVHTDVGYRKRISETLFNHDVSIESKQKMSAAHQKLLQDPEYVERRRTLAKDPERNRKISEKLYGRKFSDEHRLKISQTTKTAMQRPDVRENFVKGMKNYRNRRSQSV